MEEWFAEDWTAWCLNVRVGYCCIDVLDVSSASHVQ